jgi:hypothetical protein
MFTNLTDNRVSAVHAMCKIFVASTELQYYESLGESKELWESVLSYTEIRCFADLVVNHLKDNPDEFEKVCRDLKTLQQESRTDWINLKKSLMILILPMAVIFIEC